MRPPGNPELGSLALDFLHTLRRTRVGTLDLVGTPEGLATWLLTYGDQRTASRLREPLSPPDGRLLLDEAQRLRTDIAVLVSTYASSGSVDAGAAFGINRVLRACPRTWLLVADGRPVVVEHAESRGGLATLSSIAEAAARLVATVQPVRIRACAARSCGAWFVDTSKGGRRKWCSMAGCGNR